MHLIAFVQSYRSAPFWNRLRLPSSATPSSLPPPHPNPLPSPTPPSSPTYLPNSLGSTRWSAATLLTRGRFPRLIVLYAGWRWRHERGDAGSDVDPVRHPRCPARGDWSLREDTLFWEGGRRRDGGHSRQSCQPAVVVRDTPWRRNWWVRSAPTYQASPPSWTTLSADWHYPRKGCLSRILPHSSCPLLVQGVSVPIIPLRWSSP